ncbi:ankyrin repeat domain-containing protein [Bacillus massiliigorillae]|uniref:ankyrin repeat domain-containing protein n=1 Tax=Bacillus massiliigorillae TaxID=1243664 RepID=UPI0003A5C06E|nr:ankyrin repeat domain-containing protein [Bacillus massiliigorillae]
MDIKQAVKEDDVEYLLLNLENDQKYCLTDDPLLLAVKHNKQDTIRFLFEENYHLNSTEETQEELLYLLSRKGNNEFLMKVLREITYTPYQLNKALGKSASGGDFMTVRILINSGAQLNQNSSLIEDAISQNNVQVAFNLLTFADDIFYKDQNDDSYIHHAAYSGCNPILLQYLIFRGLDVNMQNKFGHSPIMLAILGVELNGESDFYETTKVLYQAGADVNLQDVEGYTALMHACYFENYSMHGEEYLLNYIQFLLSIGADIHIKNVEGKNALEIAKERGFYSAAEILADYLNNNQEGIPHITMRSNSESSPQRSHNNDTSFLSENGYSTKISRIDRWQILEKRILKQYSIQEVIDKLSCIISRFKSQRNGTERYDYCIAEWQYDIERLIAFRKKCAYQHKE